MEQLYIEQGLRLQKLIKELGFNQLSLAKHTGLAQPSISRMMSGRSRLSVELLDAIAKLHSSVNLHWLLTGQGEMFFDAAEGQVNERAAEYGISRLDALEARVERLEKWQKEKSDK